MVSGSVGYAWVQDPVLLGAAPVQLDTIKLKKKLENQVQE
jgi:hypothetical protein